MRKHFQVLLCGLLAFTILALPILAQPDKRPFPPEKAANAQIATMVKVLKLKSAQQTKMRQRVQEWKAAVLDWEGKNGTRTNQVRTDLQKAMKAKDQKKAQSLQQRLITLYKMRDNIIQQRAKAIMDVLTPAQQQAWTVYNCQQAMLEQYKPAKLTVDQQNKISALCKKTIEKGMKGGILDMETQRKLQNELVNAIENNIITPAQRKQLVDERRNMRPKMPPMRVNPPAGASPGMRISPPMRLNPQRGMNPLPGFKPIPGFNQRMAPGGH